MPDPTGPAMLTLHHAKGGDVDHEVAARLFVAGMFLIGGWLWLGMETLVEPALAWTFIFVGALFVIDALLKALFASRNPLVGKVSHVIDERGITWHGRTWYTLWRWRPIWRLHWQDVTKITRFGSSLKLQPKGWKRLLYWTTLTAINCDEVDHDPQAIVAAIRHLHPGVAIETVLLPGARRC